jgi:hypothetical protein
MSAQPQYLTLPTDSEEFVQNQAIDGKENYLKKLKQLNGFI